MKYSGKIFPMDKYIIEAVRRRRQELGMTQEDLSLALEVSSTFVNHVESSKYRTKYNIHHLNKLAETMNCSISDFLPSPYLKDNR